MTETTRKGTDNQDIRAVLGQLIDGDGTGPDQEALCDATVDAAARLREFMLDHAHNESRLAQVMAELAHGSRTRAA